MLFFSLVTNVRLYFPFPNHFKVSNIDGPCSGCGRIRLLLGAGKTHPLFLFSIPSDLTPLSSPEFQPKVCPPASDRHTFPSFLQRRLRLCVCGCRRGQPTAFPFHPLSKTPPSCINAQAFSFSLNVAKEPTFFPPVPLGRSRQICLSSVRKYEFLSVSPKPLFVPFFYPPKQIPCRPPPFTS